MSRIGLEENEIFYRRAFEYAQGAARSISRKTPARVTSRQRHEIARIDFSVDPLQRLFVLSAWREILFQFFIPGELIAPRNVRSQSRQLFRRQCINGLFDFCETHEKR